MSDAEVGVEFDCRGASSDEDAVRESVVADVPEIRSPLAAFLLIGASSFSAGRGGGGAVVGGSRR